jgi:hypothetical protein
MTAPPGVEPMVLRGHTHATLIYAGPVCAAIAEATRPYAVVAKPPKTARPRAHHRKIVKKTPVH